MLFFPALFSRGGGFTAKPYTAPAVARKVSAPSCPGRGGPQITSAERGESQPGGGRAADLDDWSDRGPVRAHVRPEQVQKVSWSFYRRPGGRRSLLSTLSNRQLAFNSRVPPAGSQAPSTRYSCMRRWSRETVSTRLQPMSPHVSAPQPGCNA